MQPARGVDQDRVATAHPGFALRHQADVHRVRAGAQAEKLRARLPRHNLELLDGGRPVHVRADQQRLVPLLLEVHRELPRGRRLALALQAHQHHYRRRPVGLPQALVLLAHQFDQFVVHYLHDLLAGMDALQHLLTDGGFLHIGHELLDDLVVHIRFEKGHADFLHGVLHVLFGQAALPANVLEGRFKLLCQALKHNPNRDSIYNKNRP